LALKDEGKEKEFYQESNALHFVMDRALLFEEHAKYVGYSLECNQHST
jgi:hypothetical protein